MGKVKVVIDWQEAEADGVSGACGDAFYHVDLHGVRVGAWTLSFETADAPERVVAKGRAKTRSGAITAGKLAALAHARKEAKNVDS